jgi:hypothetical protein
LFIGKWRQVADSDWWAALRSMEYLGMCRWRDWVWIGLGFN